MSKQMTPFLSGLAARLGRKPKPALRRPIVSVIDIKGRIGAELGMVSLESLSPAIDAAFAAPRPDALLLRINCSGGAPAQAEMIHRRIRILADLLSVPVVASVEDAATSAGYWIALAADEILAQESSLIGSVGTASYQFGFEKLLERLGVERRVQASGPDKVGQDPFVAPTERSRELAAELQADIHATFKRVVATRRGARLKAPIDEVTLGTTWSGGKALQLGLIDGIHDIRAYLGRRFQAIPEMRIHRAPATEQPAAGLPSANRLARAFNGYLAKNLQQALGSGLDLVSDDEKPPRK